MLSSYKCHEARGGEKDVGVEEHDFGIGLKSENCRGGISFENSIAGVDVDDV